MPDTFLSYSVSLEDCQRIAMRALLPAARSARRIPRGEVNCLFDVELADDTRVVLKVQVHGPRKSALLMEREACRLVSSAGVPAPTVLDVNFEREILPHNYALLTYVNGMDGDSVLHRLGWPQQRSLARSLGRLLGRIHAIELSRQLWVSDLPVSRSPTEWAEAQARRFRTAYDRHRRRAYLPPELVADAAAFWREREPLLLARQLCLVHGDYQVWNVKVREWTGDVAGILDLDQVDIGQAEFDFAALECGIMATRSDLRTSFYEGYGEVIPLAADSRRCAETYALLRHLELILAYQGPVQYPDTGESSAQAVARLIRGVRADG